MVLDLVGCEGFRINLQRGDMGFLQLDNVHCISLLAEYLFHIYGLVL